MKLITSCLVVSGLLVVAHSTMKPLEMNIYQHVDEHCQHSHSLPLFELYGGKQSYAHEFAHEECNYDQNAGELFLYLDYSEFQTDTTTPQAPDTTANNIKTNDVSEGNDMSIKTMQQLDDLINARLRKQKLMCCDRVFDSSSHLETHLTYSHRVDNKLSCFECDYNHKHARLLAQHIRKHLDEAIYHCPKCAKNTVNIAGLKNHFKSHITQSSEQHETPKPGVLANPSTVDDLSILRQCMDLIKLRENGLEKKCCGITYGSKKSLQKHLTINHLSTDASYLVDGLAEVEKYLLKKDRTLYACPFNDCGKLHDSSYTLLVHYSACLTKKTLRNNLIKNLKRKGINTAEYGDVNKKQRLV